jgi:hypothetical protein
VDVEDVEDVVAWACQELTLKRRGGPPARSPLQVPRHESSLMGRWLSPPGIPEIQPMFAGGFATARIDGGRPRPPHPDALLVEAAIGALPTAMADLAAPAELGAGIGLALDLEGAWAHALGNVANLVLVHGRSARRPDFGGVELEVVPRVAGNGRIGVWIEEAIVDATWDGAGEARAIETAAPATRKGDYPAGSYCGLEYRPEPQGRINDRADYLAWRLALSWLAQRLEGRLEGRAALPPAAALAPWLGERDGMRAARPFFAGAERVHGAAEAGRLTAQRAAGGRRTLEPPQRRAARPPRPGRMGAGKG